MAKGVKEFIFYYDVCSKLSLFLNSQPLKPVEVNYPFKLVSFDIAHITMPSGIKK